MIVVLEIIWIALHVSWINPIELAILIFAPLINLVSAYMREHLARREFVLLFNIREQKVFVSKNNLFSIHIHKGFVTTDTKHMILTKLIAMNRSFFLSSFFFAFFFQIVSFVFFALANL